MFHLYQNSIQARRIFFKSFLIGHFHHYILFLVDKMTPNQDPPKKRKERDRFKRKMRDKKSN